MSTSLAFACCTKLARSSLHDAHRVYSASTGRISGVIADQTIALDGYYTSQDYPARLWRIRFKTPRRARRWCSLPIT
jgi:hypothetical protein